MAPVTPKITLSTPCRGCSPWVGTGGRDRDCSISWAWCGDAASSPVASTPRAGSGSSPAATPGSLWDWVSVDKERPSGSVQHKARRHRSRRRAGGRCEGGGQGHWTRPVRRVALLGAAAHCGGGEVPGSSWGAASCARDETHVTPGRLTDWGRHQVLAGAGHPPPEPARVGQMTVWRCREHRAVPAPRETTERTSFVAQQARSRARSRRSTARSGAAVVAVANQKGGVAKTTSVASLGAAFAEHGKRVLLVDLDAQACLTFSLGVDPDEVGTSINEVLLGQGGRGRGRHRLRRRGGPPAERDRAGRCRGAAAGRARAASTSCALPWSR